MLATYKSGLNQLDMLYSSTLTSYATSYDIYCLRDEVLLFVIQTKLYTDALFSGCELKIESFDQHVRHLFALEPKIGWQIPVLQTKRAKNLYDAARVFSFKAAAAAAVSVACLRMTPELVLSMPSTSCR